MANWLTYRIKVGDDVLVLADEEAQELIKNETERSKKADAQIASFLESTTTNGIIRNGKSDPFRQTAIGGMKVVIDKGDLIINGNIKNHARLTRTYNVTQENRTEVFLYRFDSVTNEITGLWRDCIIQGDIILSREDKTELPLRSSGYYDILICKIAIPAGATEITQDMIGDFRQNEYYCGYAKNILVEIDDTLTKSDAAADAAAVGTAIGNLRKETRTRDIITEKRITNLEAGLPAERWLVDDSMAYAKDVHINALPFASVDMVGGMTRKCNQLWDEQWKTGYYDTTDGNFISSSTFFACKNKVKVLPNTTYYMTCSVEQRIVFYDIEQNYISGIEYARKSVFTTPDGCYYMTFSLWSTYGVVYQNDIMINLGTTALPYEPYYDGLRSAPVTEVESAGTNIWDEEPTLGYYKVENGVFVYSSTFFASKNKIRVSPNTAYSITCPVDRRIVYYDRNKKYLSGMDYTKNSVITTPSNCYYMAFSTWSTYGDVYKNDIMINKGTTAMPYTPYRRNTLPIPAEVRALDGYGWGINDKVYNYIDFEKKQFVQRVGCVDLGTQTWSFESFYPRFNAPIHNLASVNTRADNVLSSKFSTDLTADKGDNWKGFSSLGIVYVFTTEYTDVATFKAAMSGVMLYYELATPVITDISDLLADDNLIGVEGGGTVTMVNEYGYDVPSEITYQLKGAEA